MAIFLNYISKAGILRAYKYRYVSKSDSYLYNYVTGPICNQIVKWLPDSLSPNSITLAAFFCSVLPHILIMIKTKGDLSAEVPGWLCVLTGVLQMLYNMLDNIDGKQARRLNASTPLGMLYDHGLDTITGWIVALNFCMITRVGNTLGVFYMLVLTSMISFYLAFWEQRYVGVFSLGTLSPVDEGILLVNACEVATYFLGGDFWLKPVIFNIPMNVILMCGGALFSALLCIDNFTKVRLADKTKMAIGELEVLGGLILTAVVVGFFSPTQIAKRRLVSMVYCLGLGLSKTIGHMQLSHCTGDKYHQWRKNFIITIAFLISNTLYGYFLGFTLIPEDRLLDVLILTNLFCYLHYILSISFQFQDQLNLKIFGVPPYDPKVESPYLKAPFQDPSESDLSSDPANHMFDVFN